MSANLSLSRQCFGTFFIQCLLIVIAFPFHELGYVVVADNVGSLQDRHESRSDLQYYTTSAPHNSRSHPSSLTQILNTNASTCSSGFYRHGKKTAQEHGHPWQEPDPIRDINIRSQPSSSQPRDRVPQINVLSTSRDNRCLHCIPPTPPTATTTAATA